MDESRFLDICLASLLSCLWKSDSGIEAQNWKNPEVYSEFGKVRVRGIWKDNGEADWGAVDPIEKTSGVKRRVIKKRPARSS